MFQYIEHATFEFARAAGAGVALDRDVLEQTKVRRLPLAEASVRTLIR